MGLVLQSGPVAFDAQHVVAALLLDDGPRGLGLRMPRVANGDHASSSSRPIRVWAAEISLVLSVAQTPYARVLAAAEVTAEKKTELEILHARLDPFQLGREIARQKKEIEARRLRWA